MARLLTDDERELFDRLIRRIRETSERNYLRFQYVEGEHLLTNLGFSIPEGMESFKTPIGWPRKAVQVFASRLTPTGFKGTKSDLSDLLNSVTSAPLFRSLEKMAIESACQYGPAFVFTTVTDEGELVAAVRTARSASVEMDMATWTVTAALEQVETGVWNLHLPFRVLEVHRRGRMFVVDGEIETGSGRVQCAPYVHGASVDKPLGRSRVTRPLMGYTDAGVRTLLRQEVSAEFYSAPRQALLGADMEMFTDKNGNVRPGWAAIIGGIWGIPDLLDEEGNPDTDARPEFHSLPQMSMQPFNDQFRMIAQQVSGETSIPTSYLGVVADSNPASAQALKANEIDLIRAAAEQEFSFNIGRSILARNVLELLVDDFGQAERAELARLYPSWRDQEPRSVQETSQYVAEQVRIGNFQPGAESTLRQLPIDSDDVEIFANEASKAQGRLVFERAMAGLTGVSADGDEG